MKNIVDVLASYFQVAGVENPEKRAKEISKMKEGEELYHTIMQAFEDELKMCRQQTQIQKEIEYQKRLNLNYELETRTEEIRQRHVHSVDYCVMLLNNDFKKMAMAEIEQEYEAGLYDEMFIKKPVYED